MDQNDSYENYKHDVLIGSDGLCKLYLVSRKSSFKWFILRKINLEKVNNASLIFVYLNI